ncbi:hypothetical protein M91_03459 [Bos mutus]|uniref:Uncharacterized protein n=1 Tax=Bos mutus TaxID=72004 RepID=L8I4H6_9CETA|nr:hypothetical protein M91_03459 [Bos mutus]
MEIKEEGASEEGQNFLPTPQANDTGDFQFTTCKDLVAPVRDRKLNTLVQISVIHPAEQGLIRYSSTEIVEGTRDPLFLTGVTFPSEYPIYEETKIKLTVYDVKDKSHDTKKGYSSIRLHFPEENVVCTEKPDPLTIK